ncbi:putative sugar transport protein 8-like [Capsicum annuum]|nr:putative sugar transport protein 8-like [Capsicum annuum]KAF3678822.1 putative sugar transport protein 8-like [Capsicum annuum]
MSAGSSSAVFLAMREEEQMKQQQQQQQQRELLFLQQQQQHGVPPSSSTIQSQQVPTKKRRNQPGTPSNLIGKLILRLAVRANIDVIVAPFSPVDGAASPLTKGRGFDPGRDSFITHRAFCDALAQESARNPPSLSTIGSHLYGNNMSLGGGGSLAKFNSQMPDHQDMLHFGSSNNSNKTITSGGSHHLHHHNHQFDHNNNNNNLMGPSSAFRPSTAFFQLPADQTSHQDYAGGNKHHTSSSSIQGLMQLPDLHNNANVVAPSSSSMFNLNFFQNNNSNNNNNNNNNNDDVVVDNDNNNISGGLGGLLLPSPHQFSNNNSGEGSNNSSNIFSPSTLLGHNMSSSFPSLYVSSSIPAPPMSATALLQKAAQMGSTTSCNNSSTSASLLKVFGSAPGAGASVGLGGSSSSGTKSDLHPPPPVNFAGVYGHENPMNTGNHLHDLVVNAYGAQEQHQEYGGVIGGGYNNNNKMNGYNEQPPQKKQMINNNNFSMEIGMSEEANRLTRDFLGVGEIVRSMNGGGSNNNPFGGGNFQ